MLQKGQGNLTLSVVGNAITHLQQPGLKLLKTRLMKNEGARKHEEGRKFKFRGDIIVAQVPHLLQQIMAAGNLVAILLKTPWTMENT